MAMLGSTQKNIDRALLWLGVSGLVLGSGAASAEPAENGSTSSEVPERTVSIWGIWIQFIRNSRVSSGLQPAFGISCKSSCIEVKSVSDRDSSDASALAKDCSSFHDFRARQL